jgi:hypothetical protein
MAILLRQAEILPEIIMPAGSISAEEKLAPKLRDR